MSLVETLLKTALTAPPALQEAALRVLQQQAVAIEAGVTAPTFEPLLTQRETAKRTGFSVSSLWRYEVPGHDVGGRRRYRLSEVFAYLESDAFKRRAASLRAERREKLGAPEYSN